MSEIVFIYIGPGLGVPGLPHRLTQAQADALGAGELLRQAIERGYYINEAIPAPPDDGEIIEARPQSRRKTKGQ